MAPERAPGAVSVQVDALPAWVPAERLLGPGAFALQDDPARPGRKLATATLTVAEAADLAARLRGLGLGGAPLTLTCTPALPRAAVRAARTEDARRRRDTSPGFDRPGTRLDAEGRMSLTPAALAEAIAASAPTGPVLDLGCGAGGNAIAFARRGHAVTAVELDPARLALARHNAGVYGVAGRIRFVQADARRLLAERAELAQGALLFVDPPWGAEWHRERTVLADLPLLAALLAELRPAPGGPARLWAKVPPSFDPASLPATLSWAEPEAYFGVAAGDARRVKFVLIRAELGPLAPKA